MIELTPKCIDIIFCRYCDKTLFAYNRWIEEYLFIPPMHIFRTGVDLA